MTAPPAPLPQPPSLHVYLHWPFCRSKCPYCDFNSHVRDRIEEARWRHAYARALDTWVGTTVRRPVASIFFGGGTPSLIDPATLSGLLDDIAARWPVDANAEITLEANPSTADAERFRAFRSAGVNRLSIGVQSLDDHELRLLGRGHSAHDARQAIALAQAIFPRVSFDLIWGLPNQDPKTWRRQLSAAAVLAGEHLSAYQLTIEPGTAFFRDGVLPVDEDTSAVLYEVTQEVLEATGRPAYEISNHARSGAECRHNFGVWCGEDYLGIGPGAHGRLTTRETTGAVRFEATRAIRSPEKWLAQVEEQGDGLAERLSLTSAERCDELLLSGLRLTRGIDRHRFQAITGLALEACVDTDALQRLCDAGLIAVDAQGMRATATGRPMLNALLARLLG